MAGDDRRDEIVAAGEDLDEKLIDLAMNLTDLRMSGGMAGQDRLRWPRQLYAKITSLAGYIGGSDFPPTTQQQAVHRRYKELLLQYQNRMREIREGDVAALNQLLRDRGIPNLITGSARRPIS